MEILIESGIGKALKIFLDFCKMHERNIPDLKPLSNNAERIILKWKNFVNNMIFDDCKNKQEDEQKPFKQHKD